MAHTNPIAALLAALGGQVQVIDLGGGGGASPRRAEDQEWQKRIEDLALQTLMSKDEAPGFPDDMPADSRHVRTVTQEWWFHHDRLEAKRQDVAALLAGMPDEFRRPEGETFYHTVLSPNGGEIRPHTAEVLMAMGIGLSLADYVQPEAEWGYSDGTPHFRIKPVAVPADAEV